jgi:hypothetical protein
VEGENKPALVALRRRREEIIDWLSEAFASDALALEEYEERVNLAHRADSLEALDQLVADLERIAPAAPAPATEAMVKHEPAPADLHRADKKTYVAIFGGVEKRGAWRAAKRMRVFAMMGGAELDFRDVDLPPGVTELRIVAMMGGAEIIVPPDLHVECDGWAIMGGFEDLDRAPKRLDPDAPLLRISGFCFMGGFSIETRLPGESGRQARKRRRREKKELRNAAAQLPTATVRKLGDGEKP